MTNSLIAIVQSVDEGSHDFRVAAAVVTIAKTIDRFRTMLRVAGSLRLVDQLSNFTSIVVAAVIATADFCTTRTV